MAVIQRKLKWRVISKAHYNVRYKKKTSCRNGVVLAVSQLSACSVLLVHSGSH